jgi:hypothetical protein
MRMLMSALILVSASAFAGEYVSRSINLSLGGVGGWNTTYYNCDSLEGTVEDHLTNLGAANVKVNCTGGLDTWGNMPPMPAYVRATFDAAVPTGVRTTTRTIKSQSGDNCEADVAILDAALPTFPAIKVLSRRATCSPGSHLGKWSYDLSVTE